MSDKISIGRALNALQTVRPRIVVDGGGDPYNTSLRGTQAPLVAIGKVAALHWYDEVDPFWETEDGKRIWNSIPASPVTKDRESGATQAHGAHGYFTSDGGGAADKPTDEPAFLGTIRQRVGKFYETPGLKITDLSSAHVSDRREMKSIANTFFEKAEEVDKTDHRGRASMGLYYMTFAAQGAGLDQPIYHVLTAKDGTGRVAAAINYDIDDAKGVIHIGYIGSARTLYGAATGLEYEVCKIAASKGYRVSSEATEDSEAFHRQIGRNIRSTELRDRISTWSAARVKQIASLNLEAASTTSGSKVAVGVAVRKDRTSGADQPHGDHGHFVSGGMGASPELEHDAARYAESHGIARPSINYDDIRVDPERSKAMAAAYKALPSVDESARPAYRQLAEETRQQYDYLTKTMGVTVEVTTEDPYKNAREMRDDLINNRHISVLAASDTGGAGSHPFVSADEIQMFRAVHDVFGHAATGRDFDRHGEEAAWASHSGMYSPLARQAMTTATRGQNSVLTQDGTGFPEQKGALLPDTYVDITNVTHVSKRVVTTKQRHCFGGGRAQYDLVRRGVEAPTVTKDKVSGSSQEHGEHGHFASGGGGREISNDELKAVYQGSATRLTGNDLFLPTHLKAATSSLVASRMSSTTKEMQDFVANNPWGFRNNVSVFVAKTNSAGDFRVTTMTGASGSLAEAVHLTGVALQDPSTWLAVQSDGTGGIRIVVGDPMDPPPKGLTTEDIDAALFNQHDYLNFDDGVFKPTIVDGELQGEAADIFRSAAASEMIGAWASSSNMTYMSVALQDAAESVFGLTDTAPKFMEIDEAVQQSSVLDDFLKTEHALTQETFAAAGFSPNDTVTLVRGEEINTESGRASDGVSYVAGGSVGAAGSTIPINEETYREPSVWQADAQLRPLSSWSWYSDSARSFGDHLLVSNFKVSDIVSFSSTGAGCHNENEFVVKGGTIPVDVHQSETSIHLALDADLTKDKESGASQAHGEHGHFASGSGGTTIDQTSIAAIHDRQLDGPLHEACMRLGYRAPDWAYIGESWRTKAAIAKFGVCTNLQEAMQSSTQELVRVGRSNISSVVTIEKEEVDSPAAHYKTKNLTQNVTMREATAMDGLYIRATSSGGLVGVRFTNGTDPEEFFKALDNPSSPYLVGRLSKNILDAVDTGTPFFAMGTPESEDLIRGAAVSRLIGGWAMTTNDESTEAHAVQEVAKDHFGIDDAAPWLEEAYIDKSEIDQKAAENGAVYRDLMSTMFDQTQQAFSDAGYSPTDRVSLFRGERGSLVSAEYDGSGTMVSSLGETTVNPNWGESTAPLIYPTSGSADATLRPLSSWASDPAEADKFAGFGKAGFVMQTSVPVNEVVSTWTTGFGCMTEAEMVITGGERKVDLVTNQTFRSIDPTVTKDKESGRDQAHGAHGYFSSGSGGSESSERASEGAQPGDGVVPGTSLRPIASKTPEGTYTVDSAKGPITLTTDPTLDASKRPSDYQCQVALSTLADLHEKYGLPGADELPVIRVVSEETAIKDGAGSDAEAYHIPYRPMINVAIDESNDMHIVETRPFREYDVHGEHAGHFSPAITDVIEREPVGAIKYIVAHEYGHIENSDSRFALGRPSVYSTFNNVKAADIGGVSGYSLLDAQECYAEQFAEWAMTDGNPSTEVGAVYGDIYKWPR